MDSSCPRCERELSACRLGMHVLCFHADLRAISPLSPWSCSHWTDRRSSCLEAAAGPNPDCARQPKVAPLSRRLGRNRNSTAPLALPPPLAPLAPLFPTGFPSRVNTILGSGLPPPGEHTRTTTSPDRTVSSSRIWDFSPGRWTLSSGGPGGPDICLTEERTLKFLHIYTVVTRPDRKGNEVVSKYTNIKVYTVKNSTSNHWRCHCTVAQLMTLWRRQRWPNIFPACLYTVTY